MRNNWGGCWAVVAAMLVASCSGGGGVGQLGDGAVGDGQSVDSGVSEAVPTAPGLYTLRLGARMYELQIPNGYSAAVPAPLVVVLHAFGESSAVAVSASGFREQAEANRWIAVYPQGTSSSNVQGGSFNGYHCCGVARSQGVNDVMFVQSIVTQVQQTLQINSSKVFAVGFDNGGMLAHRLAIEASDVFAAVAIIGASVTGQPTQGAAVVAPLMPSQPVSVLIVHGRIDTVVPYLGGLGVGNAVHGSVDDSVRYWVGANRCAQSPRLTVIAPGLVQNVQRNCDRDRELTTLSAVEGSHLWRVIEPHGLSTAQTIAAFFERNTR